MTIEHRRSVTFLAVVIFLASVEAATLLGAPPCPNPHGVHAYAHPEDCNAFFLCTNGTLTLEYCENGLLFDGHGAVHDHCNYHWAVHCGERKADLTPLSSPGCEYQFGLYPASDLCSTTYIKCVHGHPEEAHCDAGLVYDEKSHTCVWPDQLLPYCNPEEIVGFKCPHKVPSHSAAAKFWPYPRFPVPGDCGRLITCVDGNPRLLTCGDGKLFDSVSLSCLDPDELPHCANTV
ncbi:protein obstructor-E-like [Bombus vosnesenskii]|uniref:Protein obstructor-E-like n=3 Tax=Pyrobombus TaxID=144703 RepID=A0A6J3KJV2_9HYME|nr:protein obstructor-E [Bombus impatiens]XP_033184457.1 protein obstructor-E-like [Bombus vancouverensis nearcticus]XP_033300751.1 protein obstructor-E-like [Bombus bifarius]XP_033353452.1 protein obstructor-E-like [Bombus vosnesenskii]XP_050472115.1 protein obstructor-E-like [Bombus huntii]